MRGEGRAGSPGMPKSTVSKPRVTQGHRNRRRSIRHLRLPINVPYSNHGHISRTISRINGDFSRKSQFFPPSVYFASPVKRFALNWALGIKKKLE